MVQGRIDGPNVATETLLPPSDERAILENSGHGLLTRLESTKVLQVMRRSPTFPGVAPANSRAITQERREGSVGGLNVLHVVKPVLDTAAVTATSRITPCDDGSIPKDRCEGLRSRLDLLHAPQLWLYGTAFVVQYLEKLKVHLWDSKGILFKP